MSPTKHATQIPRLMTAKEVAALARVDLWTVYRWRNAGLIPAKKAGRRSLRFERDDIERFLAGRR